jgi:hypothetical protein
VAARYLAKYVGKDFGQAAAGLHRYECAKGYQPGSLHIWGKSESDVLDRVAQYMGGSPRYLWRSALVPEWDGPPSLWMSWV